MKNLGLKLFSILVAIGLSLFVNGENNSSVISFTTPVEIKNLPPNKMLIKPLSPSAKVMVRGPSYLVKQLLSANNTFKVIAPRDLDQRFRTQLNKEDLNLPAGVQILALEPAEIELFFDTRESKQVPVRVTLSGRLGIELKLGAISTTPAMITLSGPSQDLLRVDYVETEPLDLSTLSQTTDRQLPIKPSNGLIGISPREVRAFVEIGSIEMVKEFKDIPIELRSRSGQSVILDPPLATIQVRAPKGQLESLKLGDLTPYVKLSNEIRDNAEVELTLEAPRGVTLVHIEPAKVRLTILEHKNLVSKK